MDDELDGEENRVVRIFQENLSSVVFIKDIELAKVPKSTSENGVADEENAKVEGSGSGFIWDDFGHIVTNYHVVSKLATDRSGLQLCKLFCFSTGICRVNKELVDVNSSYKQVISGLGREIPSPNGKAIRGAIQTDAAINAGSGTSSGVNFAIPIDSALRIVPYLIVYGTPYVDRY
ncbi:Protease Do-like 5- chloroplastic [Striga hermonthica]|uniref:Protease Do-like 5- chloroplastic n=1 Tax=Striga hermonthica TaxID=68872 RepID=A0A9N7NLN9_STRHE|nr:Protease Do-like 5- chloroplastic [Striga hermonthica]